MGVRPQLVIALLVVLLLSAVGAGFWGIRASSVDSRAAQAAERALANMGQRLEGMASSPRSTATSIGDGVASQVEYLRGLAKAAQDDLRVYTDLRGNNDATDALGEFLDSYHQHLNAVMLHSEGESQRQALEGFVNALKEDLAALGGALGRGEKSLGEAGRIASESAAARYLASPALPLQVSGEQEVSFLLNQRATIRATNVGTAPLELVDDAPVAIYVDTGEGQWKQVYAFPELRGGQTLGPGQSREWQWDQHTNAGYLAVPGRYVVRVAVKGWQEFAFIHGFQVK